MQDTDSAFKSKRRYLPQKIKFDGSIDINEVENVDDGGFDQMSSAHSSEVPLQDEGDSVKVYMTALSHLPLLTRDEEIEHATGLNQAKAALLNIFCKQPIFNDFLVKLTDCDGTHLRRIFSPLVEKNAPRCEIVAVKDALLKAALHGPKESTKVIAILEGLSFTFNELKEIAALFPAGPARIEAASILSTYVYHRKKLAEGNLRLVFHRAKRHTSRGLPLEDLLQDGNLGLLRAIEKYDVSKGFKFGTYATHWIDQALGRACSDKGRTIRIPIHMVENINRITRIVKDLALKLGCDPTNSQIHEYSDMRTADIDRTLDLSGAPQSIEEAVGDGNLHISEFLIQTSSKDQFESFADDQLKKSIISLLEKLPPKEEAVLRFRFGIGLTRDATLQEIGNLTGITRERVRQIEECALEKMQKLCKTAGIYPREDGGFCD